MTDDYRVQISTRIGGDMINFRSNSAEDPTADVAQMINDFSLIAGDVLNDLAAIAAAGKDLVQAQAATNQAANPAPVQGGYQGAPAPAAAGVQNPAGGTGAPDCPHGVRVFKSGHGAKGAWSAWFCPLPKNTPGACKPQWID